MRNAGLTRSWKLLSAPCTIRLRCWPGCCRESELAKGVIKKTRIWQIIGASSVGTMIEWYDFYIFGSLATIIAPLFYPQGNNTLALIAYLSTFAVGFVVRPFGALFFGRIGDLVGRKYAFLVTLLIMGGATALIGFCRRTRRLALPPRLFCW